jgi:hypothetical protein
VDSFGEPQVLTITQILAATRINWRATRDSTHFPTVHRWFRIFSWSKIETTFGVQNDIDRTPFAQLQVPAADAALLMVCVWLSTQYVGPYKPGLKIEFPLYEGVKHTFSLLKCLMQPTLELMQCGALITLVEYGHGLFPTAHETLSETVAMARIYGLSLEKYVPEKALEPWTPVEEETSTLWWCLFEFDQYAENFLPRLTRSRPLTDRRLIHQDPTGKNLPFLMPAPAEDDLLPPNRTGDISCTTTPPLRLPLSAPASIMVGDRRRSAQSAAVLHRALVWESRWTFRDKKGITHPLAATNSDTNSDGSLSGVSPLSEREQDALDAPIRAILQAMVDQTDKWEIFCECFSMCLSAMYTLYVPFLPAIEKLLDHTPPEQLSQLLSTPDTKYGKEAKALAALKFSARFVSDLSREFNKGLQTDPSKLAETVVAPAIQTCGISMEVFLRLGDLMPDARERFEGVWRSVLWFTQRWGLGGNICHFPTCL